MTPAVKTLAERLDEYDGQRVERERFVEDLKSKIVSRLKEAGIETALVEGRVKETHSLARHLAEKPNDDREDLTALRAVLLYASQTEHAVEAISGLFGMSTDYFRDESDIADDLHPWEFAYRSRHLKFKPTNHFATRLGISIPQFLLEEWFEVQVRSLAAHLWSAIDHKVRYKTPFPLKNDEARSLFMVAAQLEAIDRELDSIRDSLEDRVKGGALSVLAGQYSNNNVSADGVRAMIHSDPGVVRALAIARTIGWTLLTRFGHEHLEGGHVDSPAEISERESCESLRVLVTNVGINRMDALREKVIEMVTPEAVQRLVTEAETRGLATATYPADLIALLYQSTHPCPEFTAYKVWQAAINAILDKIQIVEEN